MISRKRRMAMVKRVIAVLSFLMFALAAVSFAFVVLTKEDALKEVFFSGAEIEKETKELTGATLAKIKERLGGNLIYTQEGSESAPVEAHTKIDFYFAKKDGERRGVAIIDVEPGKWGPVEIITAMTTDAVVKNVRVMSYQEQRGQPIARSSFMNQYNGKTSKSPLTVDKDIIPISGATISSRAATFTVRKALVIYEEVYLKK
jgi:Na+-translocating ferredoxin:NAD+ oxidoreductase RnfG subunit